MNVKLFERRSCDVILVTTYILEEVRNNNNSKTCLLISGTRFEVRVS